MKHGLRCVVVGGLATLAGIAGVGAGVMTPSADASVTPSMTSSTATPLPAGATGNLDLDLHFAPSAGDTPKALTIALPPGYLADAAIDNGACLTGAPQISGPSPCQIGSGVITATVGGTVPIIAHVNFYLVPPPASGDLAGLAVGPGDGTQIGATGPIVIRPSGDPDGVGVTIGLTLPNTQAGESLSISQVDSTFTGLRFPATCPATPSAISLGVDSYGDPTVRAASLPIPVSGCGALAYAPTFAATVSRQGKAANITTTITQSATQSPNETVALALPFAQLTPKLSAFGLLCANPASGTCTPVASVTAISPDYPKPLIGSGYLTGSLSDLELQIVFPAPFPLTLIGSVNLKTNVTTFTGLPDFPLTSLAVRLPGGAHGLFNSTCGNPTGTATSTTTDQNGDKTATASSTFTTSGCGNSVSDGPIRSAGHARLTGVGLSGLSAGSPSLHFTVDAGRATKVREITVELPSGLSVRRRRTHGRFAIDGVSLHGGTLKSARASKDRLVLTLRSPSRAVTVRVSSRALSETAALRRSIAASSKRHRGKRLTLAVLAQRTNARPASLHTSVAHLSS